MSWYYVDASGNTQGPLTLDQFKQKYSSNQVTEGTYVWNGADVSQWTELKQVPSLLAQLKPQNIPGPPSSGGSNAPVRPNRGGGGRASLLSAIQSKPELRKTPVDENNKGNEGGGGDNVQSHTPKQASQSNVAASKGPAKISLQEQMAAHLKRRNEFGGGAAAPKKVGGDAPAKSEEAAPKKDPPPKNEAKEEKKVTPALNKAPTRKWGAVSAEPKSPAMNGGGGGGDSSSMRVDNIKAKLDGAEEWQLKAIEKILS